MDFSTDWQNSYKTNDKRMEHLLKEKKYVDCKFLVGIDETEQEEFSGHKLILSVVSPVFETMFYGSLAEKSDLIKIPDITPKTFQSMMEYIYLQKCNLSSTEDAIQLIYAAKKYSLKDLDDQCINYLKRRITSTNVCLIYEVAELYNENALMETCKQHISRNSEDVLSSENFLSAKAATVLMILNINPLEISSEISLFNALQKYAFTNGYTLNTNDKERLEARSDESSTEQVNDNFEKDKVLIKEAVKKIRFLTMTPKEFCEGPGKSQLLTDFEGYSILLNISSPNIRAIPEGFCSITKSRNNSIRAIPDIRQRNVYFNEKYKTCYDCASRWNVIDCPCCGRENY